MLNKGHSLGFPVIPLGGRKEKEFKKGKIVTSLAAFPPSTVAHILGT
jgi:hypothetical protein